MNKNLPTTHPAEVLAISPESLEIANAYLQCTDMDQVAEDLDISKDVVVATLQRREVRAYIDNVFLDVGFNNRFKMREAIDAIIKKKFQEMEEAGIGSNKDIIEILTLSHKMTMDLMDRQIKLEKLRATNVKTQTNIQINDGSSNYSNLIERLVKSNQKG